MTKLASPKVTHTAPLFEREPDAQPPHLRAAHEAAQRMQAAHGRAKQSLRRVMVAHLLALTSNKGVNHG